MAEFKKLNDLELEKVDGGWITYNPIEDAWQAISDEDYSVLGTFPGEYTDGSARYAAMQRAAQNRSVPCEMPYMSVMKQQDGCR